MKLLDYGKKTGEDTNLQSFEQQTLISTTSLECALRDLGHTLSPAWAHLGIYLGRVTKP